MRKNSQITDLPKINFRAYGGDDPFIFVSYSHRDDELVYPELKRLRSLGFNIWYDEGLGAGNVWADELARRLRKCALTIYFISPNSVLSRFCANEVCYALEIEKPVLLVHLRPAILSPGLHMQLGSIQGILKYQLSESLYAEKLKESLDRLMGDGDGGAGALVAAEVERELPNLPLGVVTLFRVEISESQDLANALGDRYADVVVRLRHLMRDVISRYSGIEIESSGDTHFSAFRDARNGVHAAIGAQYACAAEKWPTEGAVNLRMGLHTGQPSLIENTYIGVDVHRALQIAAVGSGGQILMSSTTRTFLSDDDFPQGTVVRDLGLHRLQNMPYPEALYDLAISGLNDKFEHVASITNRPTNLPTALTNFVGRNRELTQICKTLMLADTRILTLTGPGGTGKTRLAIEAASRLAKHFPDGVFIVRLSAITDPTLVIFTIAETLGVTEFPGQTQTESLINHLANRRMLLVMDNFEHIVEGATALLDLLHDCSGVKVIVTSREPLNLRPEREFSVMPLQLPHPAPAHRAARWRKSNRCNCSWNG